MITKPNNTLSIPADAGLPSCEQQLQEDALRKALCKRDEYYQKLLDRLRQNFQERLNREIKESDTREKILSAYNKIKKLNLKQAKETKKIKHKSLELKFRNEDLQTIVWKLQEASFKRIELVY